LGFRYVDEEIITRAAEKQGVDPAAIADAERRKSVILRVLEGPRQSGAARATPGGPMWGPDAAPQRPVVMGAHAAAFALAGRDDLVRVLVTAPVEIRTRRLAEARGGDQAQ